MRSFKRFPGLSFRARLIAAMLAIETLVIAAMTMVSLHDIDRSIAEQTRLQIEQARPLFEAALAAALERRDLDALADIVRRTRTGSGIDYMVLRDERGEVLVTEGWDESQRQPAAERGAAGGLADSVAITLRGRRVGTLDYGRSREVVHAARHRLVVQAGQLSLAAFVVSALLLVPLAMWLTRDLRELSRTSRLLAAGDLGARAEVHRHDEVGEVAAAFNGMVERLAERIDELKVSEARLDLVLRATMDGVWDWDVANDTYYLSPRFKELLGYREDELPDERSAFLDHLHPEDRPRVEAAVERHFSQRTPYDIEYRLRGSDGGYRWFRARGQAVWDRSGKVVRFAGATSDVMAQKRAEAEIGELAAQLEQRVHERTAELRVANRELEAFSYSVSHDLTAPLRSIDGFSRMLAEDYRGRLDEQADGYLARIRAGTARMQQLIDDLLSLSRITRNEMRRETVDLSAIARRIAAELEQSAPGRKVEFVIAPDMLAAGDPNLLGIALTNLLRNAWKFTSKHEHARIEAGVTREDGQRTYFVRDDGAGFDMRYASKLFSPFQRMHGVQEFEGTGIGLAIVHRIIQRHGGRIWAEAEPEKGATFRFTLG